MAQLGLAQAQVTSLALHINSDSHNDTINADDTGQHDTRDTDT